MIIPALIFGHHGFVWVDLLSCVLIELPHTSDVPRRNFGKTSASKTLFVEPYCYDLLAQRTLIVQFTRRQETNDQDEASFPTFNACFFRCRFSSTFSVWRAGN